MEKFRIKYKVVETNGTMQIEATAQSRLYNKRDGYYWEKSHQITPTTWVDLGNGQHVREEVLEELTEPYGGDHAKVWTDR